ncbi:hypothetical protein C2W62_01435 [Candidatus Entotheonella serta]|nr:hypothetical protein C2W62_01435 [Candidatus Entotheonella serta]
MHGVDLTAIESVADLRALIDDTRQEIERREAQEREQALRDLEVIANRYGKSIEEFLNLSRSAGSGKKSSTKKASARKKIVKEETSVSLHAVGEPNGSNGANDSPTYGLR